MKTFFDRAVEDYKTHHYDPPREKKAYREYNQGWEAAKRKTLRLRLLTQSP